MEKVKIRQATKQGFIECVVGGGCRSLLSQLKNKAWSSARERTICPTITAQNTGICLIEKADYSRKST